MNKETKEVKCCICDKPIVGECHDYTYTVFDSDGGRIEMNVKCCGPCYISTLEGMGELKSLTDELMLYIHELGNSDSFISDLGLATTHLSECYGDEASLYSLLYELRIELVESAIISAYKDAELVQDHLLDFIRNL